MKLKTKQYNQDVTHCGKIWITTIHARARLWTGVARHLLRKKQNHYHV